MTAAYPADWQGIITSTTVY